MKISRNNRILGDFKNNKELLSKIRNDDFISLKEVRERTGFQVGTEKQKFVDLDGEIFAISVNKYGNAENIVLWAETFERKERQIGKYTDDVRTTISDAGGYLINGLLFSNGYGDGVNRVIIRTFHEGTAYTSRAEIYDAERCIIVHTPNGVKVWEHDCADINTVPPFIDERVSKKIIIHGRTLYIIITNDK